MINVSPISYGFAMSILDIIMETLCKYYSITVWTGWMRTSLSVNVFVDDTYIE